MMKINLKTHLSWTEKFKLSLQKKKTILEIQFKNKRLFAIPKVFKDYKENVLKPNEKDL
ncbi:hypothetical protein [Metamycoplasma hominis]|uniref:hypothetical protein n=1 Tax=Metamycoplasma hominis TaxID=2098 RepID=UPI001E2A4D40|nr:hypothetical protein [Metamycoplasma hominis]